MTRKYLSYCLLCIFLPFAYLQTINAQEDADEFTPFIDLSQYSYEDYQGLTLPPLDILIENAKRGPVYQLSRVKEQIERSLLRKDIYHFLSFFSLRGSYQYGMFGTDVTYSDVYTPVINNYSTSAQSSYTIGAALSIPLDQIIDYPGRLRRQRLNVKTARLEREMKFEELQREIIELYATAISQMNVLKLRAESVILSTVQYNISEKDFTNGAISSSDLSIEKERQTLALERFENTKFELSKSLMILEVITRTPLLKK